VKELGKATDFNAVLLFKEADVLEEDIFVFDSTALNATAPPAMQYLSESALHMSKGLTEFNSPNQS
jgi:hypothetical protein